MKKRLFVLILVLSMVMAAGSASAVSLTLAPPSQTINSGGFANVVLNISGLGNGGPPSLGAFDLAITFDDTILSLNSALFGPFLGNPGLGEAITIVDTSLAGEMGLLELSLLLDTELDGFQSDGFTLAALTFMGISPGISMLGIENVVLSDALGNVLQDPILQSAGITVTSIPEPATLLLFAAGLLGLGVVGREKVF